MKKLLFVIILAISLPIVTFAQGGLGDGLGDAFNGGNGNEGNNNNTENNSIEVPISNLALVLIGGIIGTTMLIKARKKVSD